MKRIILITAFISTALISCTDNDSPHRKDESLSIECYTRSTENKKDIVQDFGMFIYTSDMKDYTGVNNPVHVSYLNGWSFPNVTLSEEIAQIYCFYPYSETANARFWDINLFNQLDYLVSSNLVIANKENPSVSIIMKHILSKINVLIDNSSECKVKLLSIPVNAKYDLINDRITLGESSELDTNASSFYIFPSNNQQLRMDITYNGKVYEYVETANSYNPGKEYTFSLTINKENELVIDGNIAIIEWKEAGNFNGSVNEK